MPVVEFVDVVASFYPLAAAAEAPDFTNVVVDDLTPAGLEPHDLELTPQQIDDLITADLVVYLGGGFQPAVERAVEQAEGSVVDVVAELERRALPILTDDPHVWLAPALMQEIVGIVEDAIVEVARNAGLSISKVNDDQGWSDALESLHGAFAKGLGRCDSRIMVTAHDAFGYLAARYDLEVETISGISPEAEPDPRTLARLSEYIDANDVSTIFTEPLLSARAAETLARETGARIAVLDPIESLTAEQIAAGEDYLSVMEANLTALMEGLGCR
jgi:zinc transport system substrate-binding protein